MEHTLSLSTEELNAVYAGQLELRGRLAIALDSSPSPALKPFIEQNLALTTTLIQRLESLATQPRGR